MSPPRSPTSADEESHDNRASPEIQEVESSINQSTSHQLPVTPTHVPDKVQTVNPTVHQLADTVGSSNPRLKFVPAVPTSPTNPLLGRTRNRYLSVKPVDAPVPVPSSPPSPGHQGVKPSRQPDPSGNVPPKNEPRCRQCKQPITKVRLSTHNHQYPPC